MPADTEETEEELADEQCPQRIVLQVTPVTEPGIARDFAVELAGHPLVDEASLRELRLDAATYEIDTPDEQKLVQFLVRWPRWRLRRTRILPGRVELMLQEPLRPAPERTRPSSTSVPTAPPEAAAERPMVVPSPVAPSTPALRPVTAEPTASWQVLTVHVDVFFPARHFLVMDDQRGPTHPHAWRVRGKVTARLGDGRVVVLPFAEAKRLLRDAVGPFHGSLLNDVPPFDQITPTCANIAATLYRQLSQAMAALPLHLVSVSVWDSPASCATFPDPDASPP